MTATEMSNHAKIFEHAAKELSSIGVGESILSWHRKWAKDATETTDGIVVRLAQNALAEKDELRQFSWDKYIEAKGWLLACAKALNYGGAREDETLPRYENMAAAIDEAITAAESRGERRGREQVEAALAKVEAQLEAHDYASEVVPPDFERFEDYRDGLRDAITTIRLARAAIAEKDDTNAKLILSAHSLRQALCDAAGVCNLETNDSDADLLKSAITAAESRGERRGIEKVLAAGVDEIRRLAVMDLYNQNHCSGDPVADLRNTVRQHFGLDRSKA